MRSLSEKKRSAAAIKSLLDLMAENRSLQSVYTMDGLYATSNQYEPPPERPGKVSQNGHVEAIQEEGINIRYVNLILFISTYLLLKKCNFSFR